MKIYKAWTSSNHGMLYVLGYFESKEMAEKAVDGFGDATTASPEKGVEEIDVIPCPWMLSLMKMQDFINQQGGLGPTK